MALCYVYKRLLSGLNDGLVSRLIRRVDRSFGESWSIQITIQPWATVQLDLQIESPSRKLLAVGVLGEMTKEGTRILMS